MSQLTCTKNCDDKLRRRGTVGTFNTENPCRKPGRDGFPGLHQSSRQFSCCCKNQGIKGPLACMAIAEAGGLLVSVELDQTHEEFSLAQHMYPPAAAASSVLPRTGTCHLARYVMLRNALFNPETERAKLRGTEGPPHPTANSSEARLLRVASTPSKREAASRQSASNARLELPVLPFSFRSEPRRELRSACCKREEEGMPGHRNLVVALFCLRSWTAKTRGGTKSTRFATRLATAEAMKVNTSISVPDMPGKRCSAEGASAASDWMPRT